MPAVIEACGSAHHWTGELTKLGHNVIWLNARHVKSFVVGNKNDFNDAKPSPAGEGWVRGFKIRKNAYLYPLIPIFSLRA